MRIQIGFTWIPALVVSALLFWTPAPRVEAAPSEMKLGARLIWGTNGEKPNDPNLKDVEAKLKDKLSAVFKWKKYFEVSRESVVVPASTTQQVKMSSKCRLEIQNLGDSWIEVKLFGLEKLVVKKRQMLKPPEVLILAGDDKNDTAWFVVLTSSDK